jgi:hypothetical protein
MSQDKSFFVSRTELLAWLNDLLQINYSKVEECASGARAVSLSLSTCCVMSPSHLVFPTRTSNSIIARGRGGRQAHSRTAPASPSVSFSLLRPLALSPRSPFDTVRSGAAHCQIMDSLYPGAFAVHASARATGGSAGD